MFAKVAAAFLILSCLFLRNAVNSSSIDIRQNTNETVFTKVREQIILEYEAMYLYEKFAAEFGHPYVGRLGFSRLFRHMANEELEHARKMTEYVTDRGEDLKDTYKMIMLQKEYVPKEFNAKSAVEKAIGFEMKLNTDLLDLYKTADEKKDPHLQDFLEREYLDEQVKSIRDLRILYSRLTNANNTQDIEFLIDQEFMKKYEK